MCRRDRPDCVSGSPERKPTLVAITTCDRRSFNAAPSSSRHQSFTEGSQQMQYARLGHTGLVVSRLAFGAMTFSHGNRDIASVYKVGANLAAELVGAALDAGINLFDTADAYSGGESERTRSSSGALFTKLFRMASPRLCFRWRYSSLRRRSLVAK